MGTFKGVLSAGMGRTNSPAIVRRFGLFYWQWGVFSAHRDIFSALHVEEHTERRFE